MARSLRYGPFRLIEPGKAGGPCRECQHAGCEAQRERAKAMCVGCKKRIGYGRLYSIVQTEFSGSQNWHDDCRAEWLESTYPTQRPQVIVLNRGIEATAGA